MKNHTFPCFPLWLVRRVLCFFFGCRGAWHLPCTRCGKKVTPNY
jgi:hypothetical protein